MAPPAEQWGQVVHALNWRAGWALILAGFVTGAALGLAFHRAGFWGGYTSFRRRVARLGHIALVALGMLNLFFALSPWPAPGSLSAHAGSLLFALGGASMPLVCFLTAWRPGFRHLYPIPVTALVTAAAIVVFGAST